MMPQPRTPRKFPVFVFPQSITFYLDDQSTHKQVLTLYNPYEFPVKFKVLSTSPNKYKVVDPEGTIKSRCCVDIVVRHNALMIANCNVIDKFRIQMEEYPTKQVIGRRDVEAKLLAVTSELGRGTPDPDMFQQLPTNEDRQQRSYSLSSQTRAIDKMKLEIFERPSKSRFNYYRDKTVDMNIIDQLKIHRIQNVFVDKGGTNYVALIAGVICIVGLLLPTEGERINRIPESFHLSMNFKLIFSFVLGMVTIIILRL